MRRLGIVGALSLLMVAGCGEPNSADPGRPADPLHGQKFLSSEVTVDGKPHTLVPDTRVQLEFTDDGRLIATAGCNTLSGPVRTAGGRLAAELASSEVGCNAPRQEQDKWLAEILGTTPTWRLDGAKLRLSAGDTAMVLTDKEVAVPDLSLVETTWVVTGLDDGQTASSTPAGTAASFVFHDKRVEIAAGCNSGEADYTMTGNQIRFGRAPMTRKACDPDTMRLEAAVLGVVRGKVSFEIDGDRMLLNHPSGKGLELRAQ